MNTTPRTQAVINELADEGCTNMQPLFDHARTLERELAAERDKVRTLRQALESLAYWSRNRTETRITLRNRIAAALAAAQDEAK